MSNQPTPSQPTNFLIQMATQVANGEAPPESFQAVLAQRIEHSGLNRQNIEERARDRGEGFLIEHGELLDDVLDHMEAYERGLLKQAEFFETAAADALLEGNQMLAEAISPLLEALDRYSAAYLDYGPSPYPLMNNMLITLKQLAEGTGELQVLNDLMKAGVSYHEKAIQEIDASEHTNTDGYQAKRKAFEDIIRALKELKPVGHINDIDEAVRPLQLALEAKTSADEKVFLEHTSLKPTNMPAANVLINTVQGVLDGIYTLDQLRDALYWYRSFTEQIEEQFDLAVEGKTNSLVILEELPRTREIIDLHDEMMDRMEEALEDFQEETIKPLLEEFADVIDRLEASSQVFIEAAEREGKLVCVHCGHANPPSNRTCESCAGKLPQMVDPTMFSHSTFELEERAGLEEDDDDYHMGVNTYRLFEAAYNFYEEAIDEKTFRHEIEISRKTVESSEDGVAILTSREITEKQEEMMTPQQLQTFRDSQEMFLETKHLLEEGMDEWLEGLEYFEQYIETRHRPTLETGIQLIFVASQKIQKVHKLGELAEKTLVETQDKEREEEAAARRSPQPQHQDQPVEEEVQDPMTPGPDTYGDGIG
ncbi:MAG: zinc ribbon domain-containing protein [Vulcanimicrobiota bacterium]